MESSVTDLIARHDQRIPRYTSYPTAPHFHAGIDADVYSGWLGALPDEEALSLYLHVPFCRELCLYCGCHTTVARGYRPIAAYVDLLEREIGLVSRLLGPGRPVSHIHWGGGTPTVFDPADLQRVMRLLAGAFDVTPGAEIAIEIDPRTVTPAHIDALAASGVNRASLGVQDFDETVQRTIRRIQSYDVTARVAEWLRQAAITEISIDLMYGLPHQSEASVVRTVEQALDLRPGRIALFGYAHVPWMKRHQALLPAEHLPDAAERFAQMRAAGDTIRGAGYIAIGLDHFARPGDRLALALRTGRLRRNFQGYTTDAAPTLIGFGTSSISSLPQGYAQNASRTVDYRAAVVAGRPATVRGVALTRDDRLRRAIIERLMCDLTVDVEALAIAHETDPENLRPDLARVGALAGDGIAVCRGYRVTVPDAARPFLRTVCAAFDRHLAATDGRHSRAI